MSSKKQREIFRKRRMQFDEEVKANREIADLKDEKSEPKKESKPKKKSGRKPKKTAEGDAK